MHRFWFGLSFVVMVVFVACSDNSGNAANTATYTETEDGITAESKEDLPNCSKNREGMKAFLNEGNFVCTSGKWTAEPPIYESEEDFPRCTKNREGEKAKTEDGDFVCIDGAWAKEISGYETEEDLPKCTRKKEGMVVFVEETEATLICKSGLWENASEGSDELSSSSEIDGGKSSSSISSSFNDESIYDSTAKTLTDLRDGQVYRTTTIKISDAERGVDYSQVWMAENLNYRYLGPTNDLDSSSFCYDDDPANCDAYGRLYVWSAAMDSAGIIKGNTANGCGDYDDEYGNGSECTLTGAVRGVCPKGWHLPSKDEWKELIVAVGDSTTEYYGTSYIGPYTVLSTKLLSTSWVLSTDGFVLGVLDTAGTNAYSFSALPSGYKTNDVNYDGKGSRASFWSSTECLDFTAYMMKFRSDDTFFRLDIAVSMGDEKKFYGLSVRCLKD